jgi:hypothetical protein
MPPLTPVDEEIQRRAIASLVAQIYEYERALVETRQFLDGWAQFYEAALAGTSNLRNASEIAAWIAHTSRELAQMRIYAKNAGVVLPHVTHPAPSTRPRATVGETLQGATAMTATPLYPRLDVASGELALIGRILAAPSPVAVLLDLGPDRVLHASISLNGTQYQAAMDLSALLAQIGTYAADYHQRLHAELDAAGAARVDHPAVQSAGAILIGGLLDEHTRTISAGWWKSLKKTAARTIHKLKGPIATAASFAAGAAAMAIPVAGPALAPLAGSLAHSIVHAATGDVSAQKALDLAKAAAKDNPEIASALAHAHKAVAQTAAAYHIAETAIAANDGDTAAQAKISEMATSAIDGDAGAQKALEIAQAATRAASSNAASAATVSGSGGWGPFIAASKAHAREAVVRRLARGKHGVVGYVHMMTGERYTMPFSSTDAADDWFGRLEPGTFVYAAYYDPADRMWPQPLNETSWAPAIEQHVAQTFHRSGPATVSGPAAVDPIFVEVPCVDEDGNALPYAVKWPTSQSRYHGGRVPSFYLGDTSTPAWSHLFVWVPAGWDRDSEEAKAQIKTWRPTWRVRMYPRREPRVTDESIARASGVPWLPFALSAALGAGTIGAYEWMDRRAARRAAAASYQANKSAV